MYMYIVNHFTFLVSSTVNIFISNAMTTNGCPGPLLVNNGITSYPILHVCGTRSNPAQ